MGREREPVGPGSIAAWCAAAACWGLLLWKGSPEAAFLYFLASRAAYVGFTGLSLRAQDETGWYSRRWGAEGGFRRFRAVAGFLMNNDAVAMVLVGWVTRGTLRAPVPDAAVIAAGAVLVVAGIAVKSWAVATIGRGAYYWESFFRPPSTVRYSAAGPYRWFRNPMYTVGYAHAYGAALVLRSVPMLIAALVAQALVLLLNLWAERPHTERMRLRTAGEGGR